MPSNAFEARGWQDRAAGDDHFFGGITGRFVEPLLNAVSWAPTIAYSSINDENHWEIAGSYQKARCVKVPGMRRFR
jgi:hypothetical protein